VEYVSAAGKKETQQTPQEPLSSPKTEGLMQAGKNAGKQAGQMADAVHGNITKRIINSATWLDSFFANDRAVLEENRSYVRLRYNFFLEDSSGIAQEPRISARLLLPKLEEKAHLIFSAEPDEPLSGGRAIADDSTSTQVITNTPKTIVSDKRRYTTALQYFLKSTDEHSLSLRSGLQLSGFQPVVFAGPRYRLLIPVESWNFRYTQEVMYRTDTKWQETSRFDFERPLRSLFFRTTAEGAWFEDTPGYFYSLNFVLFQPLGTQNALTYEWVNSFQSRPTGKLTDVIFRARYRHNIWHDWIFIDTAPQCRFPSDRDQRFTPGILFSLEALFGHPD
jgi:hypothetical protein